MNRRQLLRASSAALLLPAVVKAENLMRVQPLIVPKYIHQTFALEYMITAEADEEWQRRNMALALSMKRTKERVAGDVLNTVWTFAGAK